MKIRLGSHLLFWVGIALVLTLTFAQADQDYVKAFYFVSFLMPVAVATSYFFNAYLVPKYLLAKKYRQFFIYFLYTLIFSMYLEMLVMTVSFVVLANYKYAGLNPYTTNLLLMAITLYFIVLLHAFILLLRNHYKKQEQLVTLENDVKRNQKEFIQVRSNRKTANIALQDVIYIESLADYVKIHLPSEVVVTKEKISQLENSLPDDFLRIHRSFIVNGQKVKLWGMESVELEDTTLPVGRNFRERVKTNIKG